MNSQVSDAAAAAVFVTTRALTASPLAAHEEPALKPNQPNHRSAPPRTTYVTLCGSKRSDSARMRLPR